MGLTIHYTLQSDVRRDDQARELVKGLRQRALDLPFVEVDDMIDLAGEACHGEEPDHPHRWLLIQASRTVQICGRHQRVYPLCVIAFGIDPGDIALRLPGAGLLKL